MGGVNLKNKKNRVALKKVWKPLLWEASEFSSCICIFWYKYDMGYKNERMDETHLVVESARETVSLPRLVKLSTLFFFFFLHKIA